MLDYQLSTFNNGLKLITAPLANTRAVTVLFLAGVGSRYEPKTLNGLSHFLEHMFFKGTKKRPTNLEIAKALDAVGASYNAFTAEEYTGFYVRASSVHFDLALDILFDILYQSQFAEKEIAKEKGVIAEEINLYQDTPPSYIVDVAKKLFYGEHPLGQPVTGEKEIVKKFTRNDLLAYRDNFFTPDNLIIAISGGKDNLNWQEKIHQFFDKITTKKQGDYPRVKETQTKPAMLIHPKKTDQAHLILGFRAIPRTDKRRPILKVLNNLLGENMSSRLFTEVREHRGLAYYISSEMADFQDTGAFGVAAGVDIGRAEEAIKVILEEFSKLKTTLVDQDELKRAQENLKGKLYLGLEESFAVADFLAEQALFWEKIDDPDELVKKYEKVTAQDIQKFAQEFFVPKNLNLAMIGPFDKKDNFQKILGGFR
jgi:predicted Zn-dependent peptidase